MNAKLKKKWIHALRSGKYKKCTKRLKRANGFCCLGVLASIQGATWDNGIPLIKRKPVSSPGARTGYLLPSFCGLRRETQGNLAYLNDDGKSFAQIADYIEKHL